MAYEIASPYLRTFIFENMVCKDVQYAAGVCFDNVEEVVIDNVRLENIDGEECMVKACGKIERIG